jgi:hypothetical protein
LGSLGEIGWSGARWVDGVDGVDFCGWWVDGVDGLGFSGCMSEAKGAGDWHRFVSGLVCVGRPTGTFYSRGEGRTCVS